MLQCVVVCCSARLTSLQHSAPHTLHHTCGLQHTATHCNTLQHTHFNTHMGCSALQHTATHCNTLQHTATHCNTHTHGLQKIVSAHMDYNTRLCLRELVTQQHTATHCNTQQHTATHHNTLQHAATRCNTRLHLRELLSIWYYVSITMIEFVRLYSRELVSTRASISEQRSIMRERQSSFDCNTLQYTATRTLQHNPMGKILFRWKDFRNNLKILCHPICNRLYYGNFLYSLQEFLPERSQNPILTDRACHKNF